MFTSARSSSKLRNARRRKAVLSFEAIEPRLLMAAGFVGGYVTTSAGAPESNLAVSLAGGTLASPITALTNSDGYYKFDNVAPGTYTVTETQAGYTSTAAQAITTINQASPTVGNFASFTVTVVDPATQPVFVTQNANPYEPATTHFTVTNGRYNYQTAVGVTTHQYSLTLSGNQGNTSNIFSVCTDLFHASVENTLYPVTPSLTPITPGLSTNTGQVGYLYNHFGQASLGPTNGAGLQLAIWELLYDSSPSLTSGDFKLVGTNDSTIVTAAQSYLDKSAGKSEDAYFLKINPDLSLSGQSGQSMISTDLINFTADPIASGSLSGVVYEDKNVNGVYNSGTDVPIPGTTVTLVNPTTGTTLSTQITDANGAYSFTNLTPGTYKVTEVQPYISGTTTLYLQGPTVSGVSIGGVAVGSLGGTVALPDMTTDITVGAGKNGTNYNFGELRPVTLGGVLFVDSNHDCTQQTNEPGLGGVTLTLTGTDASGQSVTATTTTATTGLVGSYTFTTTIDGKPIAPGTYTIAEGSLPTGYTAEGSTSTTPGAIYGTTLVSNIVLASGQSSPADNFCVTANLVALNGHDYLVYDLSAPALTTSTTGSPIAGTKVTLTGTDLFGNAVSLSTMTDSSGSYQFTGLNPSNAAGYTVTEVPPAADTHVGQTSTTAGAVTTPATSPIVSHIVLVAANSPSTDNFFETTVGSPLAHGETATIGFWHNKNGQALIKSLNGGPTATQLGHWLATNFPNLYGNLDNKSNADIASYFLNLFGQSGQKTGAQVLATALAVYSTNTTLADGSMAAGYGFTVSASGTGAATYNVGTSLAPYGGPTGQVGIFNLLKFVNATSSNGVIGGGNSALYNIFNTIFDGINQGGDIS